MEFAVEHGCDLISMSIGIAQAEVPVRELLRHSCEALLDAGIVALMLHENPELTPAAICQILEETSLKLTPTKSNRTGVGRVDALAAVTAAAEWTPTAINEIPVEGFTDLWPNPVNDVLYLDIIDGTSVSIFDMTGRLVKQDKYQGQLDVSKLTSGVYTIKTEDITVKFVKE